MAITLLELAKERYASGRIRIDELEFVAEVLIVTGNEDLPATAANVYDKMPRHMVYG